MGIKKIIKKTKYIIIIFVFIFVCLFNITISQAKNLSDAWKVSGNTAENAGYNEALEYEHIIQGIILAVLSLLGVIFLVLMVYGGSIWMTAGGKEDRVNKAKDLIAAAVIGLVIVVSAYAISIFVVSKITEKTLIAT